MEITDDFHPAKRFLVSKWSSKMENQTLVVLDGNQVDVDILEQDVADAVVRAYGSERRYSQALNLLFPVGSLSTDWFTFEATDTSDDAKKVRARKESLYAKLKKAEHTNPSTVYARIRKYGAEDRYGKTEGEGAEGAEGEGSTQRDVTTRNVEELIKLYKFNSKQDSLPAKVREANDAIVMALKCLGVDVSMVK
jgi:hypothetical protein